MAKEFTYKGKTIEELKKMDLKEFAELLPSRERRSLKRGLTSAQKVFLRNIENLGKGDSSSQPSGASRNKKPLKTHCRNMIILPIMIGLKIMIHNGKAFTMVEIPPEAVGMRLGEFSLTRNKVAHSSPGVGATRSSAAVSVR